MAKYLDIYEFIKLKNKLDKQSPKHEEQIIKSLNILLNSNINKKILKESKIHLTIQKISKNKSKKFSY